MSETIDVNAVRAEASKDAHKNAIELQRMKDAAALEREKEKTKGYQYYRSGGGSGGSGGLITFEG